MKTKLFLFLIATTIFCAAATGCKKTGPGGDDKVPVRSIVVSPPRLDLYLGMSETTTLTVTFAPPHATDKKVTWSSDDTSGSVIELDTNTGAVTAVGIGTAIVTATSVDGGFTDQCEVTVFPWHEEIEGMVYVDGGTFTMGDPDASKSSDEQPHHVTLSDFYIGKYEVTRDQWREIMGSYPTTLATTGPSHPVESVSWNDIQEFLAELNGQASGRTYRLPTEAEWEFAAKGGLKSKGYYFSGSDDIGEVAWYSDNNGDNPLATHPVGQKKPNELGIYDMTGNVWEWCGDYYNKAYPTEPATDPTGPAEPSNSESLRVVRGGANYTMDYVGYSTDRFFYRQTPDVRSNSLGFRLVVELDGAAKAE